ncbi:uncharacterized protein TNCV_1877701 [Trichonephila clavipes]|nr:uncharacterized protein TNCV_1877701 [Trichonephila clavipes]
MDVCKCIVPLRHGDTLNSRPAASPRVWLEEGEERWETPGHPRVFSLYIEVEPNKIVLSPPWCSKLRLTTGVKILALSRDEFRGPPSDFVRQVALVTTTHITLLDKPRPIYHYYFPRLLSSQ